MKFFTLVSTLSVGLAPLASAVALPNAVQNVARTASNGFNNIVYFADWVIYARNYQPAQLPIDKLTHVLYSFADIGSDGTVTPADSYADLQKHYPDDSWSDTGNNAYGCVKQLFLLKQKNRNLKLMLSIGGWTYSPKFAPVFASDSSRNNFVTSAVKFVQDWGLDGIDIDYEYPASADEAANFVTVLKSLRAALDDYTSKNGGNKQLISVACPAGPDHYQQMDLKGMNQYVDMWNLMAYDYDGSFGNYSGHQANLYPSTSNPNATPFNTDQAITYYLSQGIPSGNINLGMPIYGRAFAGTDGLGKPFSGVGDGSWENGVWDYKVLPQAGATEMTDDESGATYSYDASKKLLISYDTKDMVSKKVQYLLGKKLGGSMFWEASADRTDDGSLIANSWSLLSAAGAMDTTQNTISYPASQYDNIKNGMK